VDNDQAKEVDMEALIKPLSLLIQNKLSKTYQDILAIFQILAASNLLSIDNKLLFIKLADKLIEAGDMILIRIIQILLLIISYEDIGKSILAEDTLNLSLHLFSNKSSLIRNNIIALLSQMYSLLFEKYNEVLNKYEEVEKLNKVCYRQVEMLIEVAGDKYKQMNVKCLGIDLLSLIFAKPNLKKSKEIVELVEKAYVPCLNNYLTSQTNSYQILTRSIKSAVHVMLTFQISYILLQPILALTDSLYNWHRYLALEAFCILFKDYNQLRFINLMVNDSTQTRVLLTLIL
jgi:hypothetical protein